MNCNRTMYITETGKFLVDPTKREYIGKCVTFHLGVLKREFERDVLQKKEDLVENADKTNFKINMDNGSTLGLIGEQVVKYGDVVSCGQVMTMIV